MRQVESYTRYIHHNRAVTVKTELMGKHREHCLCFECTHFKSRRCLRAWLLYNFCRLFGMVTPVWECPNFIPGLD